jgi:argininosuccinate lyase
MSTPQRIERPEGTSFVRPIWDRGEPLDEDMLRFTVGDDWLHDRRLVAHDIQGSLAHVAGLARAGLISEEDRAALVRGLEELLAAHRSGAWTVEPGDEDVHSAVERRLVALVGEPGLRLHTGRSRNDQVALDLRLWLREALAETGAALSRARDAARGLRERHGALPLPGYTHLRRAMPSSVGDWLGALLGALEQDELDLAHVRARLTRCPLGSGAGYGVPLPLAREHVAELLGFEGPEEPVTLTQWTRGRAELAYLGALESLALDPGQLACDLWLWSSAEFGFVRLPAALTTGSSLMPHKRNPDAIELLRAHARQLVADRAALLDVLRDLPSGYHRDLQLVKPPLFRAHDRAQALLAITARLLDGLELDEPALRRACADPALQASARALALAAEGVPFRQAYARVARES